MRCREAHDPFTKLGQYLFALHSLAARFSRMITLAAGGAGNGQGRKTTLGEWWGGPPGPRPTPPSACWRSAWLISLARQRDEGVPRGPGGPPHQERKRPQ